MILFDINHVTILRMLETDRRNRLVARMAMSPESISIPLIVAEENMRGWLASIAKERDPCRQIDAYRELGNMFQFYARFSIVPFDESAVDQFVELRRLKIRIGTMDLKIAAIALANDALLLTANRRDFEKVPGLRFENWIDGD